MVEVSGARWAAPVLLAATLLAGCGPAGSAPGSFDAGDDRAKFTELKEKVQAQAEIVDAMKIGGAVTEGDTGYLVAGGKELLSLEQRKTLQQENYWREQTFELIGRHSGRTREQVAQAFSALARKHAGAPPRAE